MICEIALYTIFITKMAHFIYVSRTENKKFKEIYHNSEIEEVLLITTGMIIFMIPQSYMIGKDVASIYQEYTFINCDPFQFMLFLQLAYFFLKIIDQIIINRRARKVRTESSDVNSKISDNENKIKQEAEKQEDKRESVPDFIVLLHMIFIVYVIVLFVYWIQTVVFTIFFALKEINENVL